MANGTYRLPRALSVAVRVIDLSLLKNVNLPIMRRKIDIDAHEQEVTRLYQNGTPTDTIKALLKGRGVTISDRTLRHRLEEWGLRTPRVRTYVPPHPVEWLWV
ncbi:hypothetical protein N7468_007780 [Penicillium chermesinum]|uniref:Clr5 domain-containing protein n=1 Tax=Penicillium chermesinum TaxID=63820 RepID=A0A9W9NQV9_9EURO|nr:uncharacterized protein N7468_007780 [Penicillium chermesinum]KAJ5223238.1 hypothetical protein N7468_007780 [Penicillium chermesinum]